MSETEHILWFLGDGATLALMATTILGFFLVWALAAILARHKGSGAGKVFEAEAKGFKSWAWAAACHAVLVLLVGARIFVFTDRHWVLIIPYFSVIVIDLVLLAVFVDKARTMTEAHR